MAKEFWRTIRRAIEQDDWTARLVVLFLTAAVAGAVCVAATGR